MKQSSQAKAKFSSYQVFVILILALTQFTVVLDFMVMSPLGDMLMKTMNLTTSQFGFAVSAYAISAGISSLLTAGFADKFDRKKLLLFFYVGFIAGTLVCGLTTNYAMLITARIITGVFGGVIGSISMAIVADLFVIQERGRVMGYMQMGFGASQVLGIPISIFLANIAGWQTPFLMIVVLATIIWVLILVKMKPVAEHLTVKSDKSALAHLWHTLSLKEYRVGFWATILLSLGGFMMMPWSAAFSINNLHITQMELPWLFMVSGVTTLIIMPMIGKLSDKVDKFKIFFAASIWMMVMVLIYTNLTPVPLWVVMLMNVLFMTGLMSRMVPAMAMTSAVPKMQDRGAYMSISSSLQQFAGGIAAAVSGLIVIQRTKQSPIEHYNTLGVVIVCISIISTFLMYRLSQHVKKEAGNVVKPTLPELETAEVHV